MTGQDEPRDLAALVVPQAGWLERAEDPWEPYRLRRSGRDRGRPGRGVPAGLAGVRAGRRPRCGRMGWRCCAGSGSCGRPGCRGIRRPGPRPGTSAAGSRSPTSPAARAIRASAGSRPALPRSGPGSPNPVTGKAPPGRGYAPATVAHCERVLRGFYDFHLRGRDRADGEPVPAGPGGGAGGRTRTTTRWSPTAASGRGCTGPGLPGGCRAQIPEEKFNELFAALGSHRDRALVAFWVSTGARASELLGATCRDADPGQQLITVIRKGTRRAAAAAGLPGRVRVAAAVSGADARPGAGRAG